MIFELIFNASFLAFSLALIIQYLIEFKKKDILASSLLGLLALHPFFFLLGLLASFPGIDAFIGLGMFMSAFFIPVVYLFRNKVLSYKLNAFVIINVVSFSILLFSKILLLPKFIPDWVYLIIILAGIIPLTQTHKDRRGIKVYGVLLVVFFTLIINQFF